MLHRKLWRDLWNSRTQFLSIFLMAFLGLLVFVGMDAESNGAQLSSDSYYQETNLADYWLTGRWFSEEDVKEIQAIPGVNLAERQLQTEGKAVFQKKDGKQNLEDATEPYLILHFLETNEISRMQLIEGKSYEQGIEGVWIDENFASCQHLKVGDTLEIKANRVSFTEEIKGIVRNPEYVYYVSDGQEMIPPYGTFGYAFLDGKEYPHIQGQNIYTTMKIDVDVTQNQDTIKRRIREVIDDDNLVLSDRSQNISFDTFDAEVEQHRMMGFLFPIVFLVIAVLGMITTMTRMTVNQRTQIGTLKALGFGKGRITLHYISFGFWISLLGAVTGSIAGFYGLPVLIHSSMKEMYQLPEWKTVITGNACMAILLEVAISTGVSFLACRKELREPAAITLKPKPPKDVRHSMLEKSRIWLRMSFRTQWNLRDVMRNRARTLMGIIGAAGCTMLMLCAFGCSDAMKYMPIWSYEHQNLAEHVILLEQGTSQKDAKEYEKKYKGQMVEEASVEITAENGKSDDSGNPVKTGVLTVAAPGSYLHFQDEKLQEIPLQEKGIMISYKMAKLLGVSMGDYIRWHVIGDDTWHTTRITQINRVPMSQGITMSRKQYEELEYEFAASKILTNHSLPEQLTEDVQVQTIQDTVQMKKEMMQSLDIMGMIIDILVLAAVLLGVIVLYNLGVLSYVEKTRQIATLKVLGFSTGRIRRILHQQSVWITSAGILVGLPAGYVLLRILCDSLSDSEDLYPLITMPSYCVTILGTFAVSFLVNFMLSGKVKTIDMVDALKGVE